MQFEILTDKGTSVKLVRYFNLNDKQFLIYTDVNDVTDEQGHLTIHISEIKNGDHIIADTVTDVDWENIKNIIKGIVNANKNNQPLPIEDLDYNTVDGVSIIGSKALKLMSNYVDLLKLNQPLFEKTVVEDIIKPTVEESNSLDAVEPFHQSGTFFNASVPTFEDNNASMTDEMPLQQPDTSLNASDANVAYDGNMDYKKLYEEQLELVKNLQAEVSNYKNVIETVKNIINN